MLIFRAPLAVAERKRTVVAGRFRGDLATVQVSKAEQMIHDVVYTPGSL